MIRLPAWRRPGIGFDTTAPATTMPPDVGPPAGQDGSAEADRASREGALLAANWRLLRSLDALPGDLVRHGMEPMRAPPKPGDS